MADTNTDVQTAVEEALNEFKVRVARAAMRAKSENGWCSEVDDLLEGLGIDPDAGLSKYAVTVTFILGCTPNNMSAEFVKSSLDIEVNDGRLVIEGDGDIDDLTYESIRAEVRSA